MSKILKRVETRLLASWRKPSSGRKCGRRSGSNICSLKRWGVGGEQGGHHAAASAQDSGRTGGSGGTIAEIVIENQHGDPRYLDEARKALADHRKIWGLDAPQKVDVRASRNPYGDMTEEALRAELARQAGLLAATDRARRLSRTPTDWSSPTTRRP